MPTLDELMASMQGVSDEERKAALFQALTTTGLGLLAAPGGNIGQNIGRAGLLGVGDYRNTLAGVQQGKRDQIKLRGEAMDALGKEDAYNQQQQMRQAAQASMLPGAPAMPPMGPPSPSGDMQSPVPAQPPSFDYKGYANRVAAIDPMRAIQIENSMAKESPFDKPKPEHYTPQSLAAFAQSRNPADLVPVAPKAESPLGKINPSDFTPSSVAKFLQAKGDYSVLVPIDKTPRNTTTVINQQEGEYAKTTGKAWAEQAMGFQQDALAAQHKVRRLNQLDSLLKGIDTNSATPVTMKVASAARAIGVNIDPKLSEKEAAQTIIGELTLAARPKGAGAMSDPELAFYQQMTPGLAQTTRGRALTIEAIKRMEHRKIQIANAANEYANRNRGQLDQGFNQYLAQKIGDANMFSDLQAEMEAITGGGVAPQRQVSGRIGSAPNQQPDIDALVRKHTR